jgi:murein DD-endopeptidase MepM/ murein hydrolase activator NlpD
MPESLNTIFVLLLIAIAFAFMLGGTKGPGKLLGCLFAPFASCGQKLASTLGGALVAMLLLYAGWQYLLAHFGSSRPPSRPQPPAAKSQPPVVSTPQPKPKPVPAPDPRIAQGFDYPVGAPDENGRRRGDGWYVSQDFEDARNAYSNALSGQHLGEDWLKRGGNFAGEGVYAIANGEVIKAGANKSYGHVVLIRHDLPPGSDPAYVVSLYGHLGSSDVIAAGSVVQRGQMIGRIGAKGDNGVAKGTGASWPPHLHFELRRATSGYAADTIDYGYSKQHPAFLNPTDATSSGNTPGGGWIDAHR